jgi:hypothetical protein
MAPSPKGIENDERFSSLERSGLLRATRQWAPQQYVQRRPGQQISDLLAIFLY